MMGREASASQMRKMRQVAERGRAKANQEEEEAEEARATSSP